MTLPGKEATLGTFERRFRLDGLPDIAFTRSVRIHQVYWRLGHEWSIRIRQEDDPGDYKNTITIKGPRTGADRPQISVDVFKDVADLDRGEKLHILEAFLGSGVQHAIDKTRHFVEIDGTTWEIDDFEGPPAGLIIAEVRSEDEELIRLVEPPSEWNAREVTADPLYNNENLAYDDCLWVTG